MERLILRSGLRLSPAGYQVLMGLTLQEMYTILLPFFKLVVYIILSISHFYYLESCLDWETVKLHFPIYLTPFKLVFFGRSQLIAAPPPNPHLPPLPWKKKKEHLMYGFHWFYAFINFSVSSQFYCLSSLVEDPCIHYYILAKKQSSLKFILRNYFCWELGASKWSHFLTVIINSILASSDVQ